MLTRYKIQTEDRRQSTKRRLTRKTSFRQKRGNFQFYNLPIVTQLPYANCLFPQKFELENLWRLLSTLDLSDWDDFWHRRLNIIYLSFGWGCMATKV